MTSEHDDELERLRKDLLGTAKEIEDIHAKKTLDYAGRVHDFYAYRPYPKQGPPYRMDQIDFWTSTAKNQAVLGGHRGGKTKTTFHKLVSYAIEIDPTRPLWRAPEVVGRRYLIWTCCPAKKTRDAIMELSRLVPDHVPHTVFYGKGEERIEFEPTARRPHGTVIRVMSYGMPVDQFQRDAVDILHFDEEPPEDIWTECEQRLVSTDGTLILSLTSKSGLVWLHKKLKNIDTFNPDIDPKYCAQSGEFAWFMLNQRANPLNSAEAIELRSQNMTEQEKLIRIDGHFIPLAGSIYFDLPSLAYVRNKDVKKPEFHLWFDHQRKPVIEQYGAQSVPPFSFDVWQVPQPGATYAIGADIGRGKGNLSDKADYSAAFVGCVQNNEIVAKFHRNDIDPMDYAVELANLSKFYNNAIVAPETNIEESAVLNTLRDLRVKLYQRESFSGKHKRFLAADGWETTSKSKPVMLKNLYLALRNRKEGKPGSVLLHDDITLDELYEFGYLSEKRTGAYGLGALDDHDDLVIALAITLMAMKQAPQGTLRKTGEQLFFSAWQSILKEVEDDEKKRYKRGNIGPQMKVFR